MQSNATVDCLRRHEMGRYVIEVWNASNVQPTSYHGCFEHRCLSETRPMLQRIYGTAWENKEQLAEHVRPQP